MSGKPNINQVSQQEAELQTIQTVWTEGTDREENDKLQPIEEENGPARKKVGKDQYEYKTSYRKANFCNRFLYIYGSKVIDSVYQNKGLLKREFIEDIKENDEETRKMMNTFMSHLESKIMSNRNSG